MSTHTEEEFQSTSRWMSFKGALFSAAGGASLFGVLNTVASKALGVATGAITGEDATSLLEPTALATVGGLVGVGATSIFMAQDQYTQLKSLQDTHLAEENAKCMHQNQGVDVPEKAQACAQEHPQNCRADGKKWTQVVAPAQQVAQHTNMLASR